MAKNRVVKHLACDGCGSRNYSKKASSKKKDSGKLALKKFCSCCRTHSLHKETK